MSRPLTCTRCGGPVSVVEVVTGYLDWGTATVGADGIVRPQNASEEMPVVMAHNSTPAGRPIAACESQNCRYQWRLRRPFEPDMGGPS